MLKSATMVVVGLAALHAFTDHAPAQSSISLEPSQDNTLYFESGSACNLSNGAGTGMFAGTNGSADPRRAVMAFDLAGLIPAGALITGAQLELNEEQGQGLGILFSLHRLATAWGESTSVAGSGGGGGGVAQTGDATWNCAVAPGVSWSTSGGDFVPAASAVATSAFPGGLLTWASPTMTADVQDWLDNPGQNFGWLVKNDEIGGGRVRRFSTRESPNSALRPRLTIQFVPYPGSSEDLVLQGGLNGPVGTSAVLNATAGDSLAIRIDSPGGGFPLGPVMIGQLFTTGMKPTSPPGFPEIHVDPGATPGPFLAFDGVNSFFGPMAIPAGGLNLL
ncbi:MAG: DNRLRE domain-containing protein, partial [Planctomycetes bacterium]|nr:DNRLRE domain-containing protein [Planctomycetota bacterium]